MVVHSFVANGQASYVQPITSSSGLYFDHLGSLKIYHDQLSVIIPLDISKFSTHIDNIESALAESKQMFKRVPILDEEAPNHMLQPLIVRFNDIKKQYASVSYLIEDRFKRAWIGGIGGVLKTIFGTLDEDDAVKYNEALDSLQYNQVKLASLMKENIIVTTSVISSYNETLNKIKINEAILSEALDKLSVELENITNKVDELHLQTYINIIMDRFSTSIFTLSAQLEDIINAILFSSQNILHPAILTPLQLYQELAENHQHLPYDLEFPVPLNLNYIHNLLNVSRLTCYYTNSKIMFVLQIPLVSIKEYVLYHVIALPVPHNPKNPDSFSLILPDTKYVAITKDKKQYCNLENLSECRIVETGSYICEITSVFTSEAKPSCESELMSKAISEMPKECKATLVYGKLDIWKLLSNNKWLFIQSELTKISIDCFNSDVSEINVLGSGILTIAKGCTGYCKSTILTSANNVMNITSPVITLDFNLLNDSCCNIGKINKIKGKVSPINLQDIDLDNLKTNKDLLSNLASKIDNIVDTPHIIKYGTHYSSLTIIIVVVIVSFAIYKLIMFFKCKSGNKRLDFPLKRTSIVQSINNIDNNSNHGSESDKPPGPSIRAHF